MTDILFLIGRILVGGFYIFNGFNHLANLKAMSGYAGMKGVPLPGPATVATGVMLLAGGASMITGLYPQVGAVILVAFLVPTAFLMHNFWAVDEEQQQMEMIHFMKDIALAGSALMYLAVETPWPLSLG